MNATQHAEAHHDRDDLCRVHDRVLELAQRAQMRGESAAAVALRQAAHALALEAAREVPEPRKRPAARAPKSTHPWRGGAVLPARGHGGGT